MANTNDHFFSYDALFCLSLITPCGQQPTHFTKKAIQNMNFLFNYMARSMCCKTIERRK